MGVSRKVLIFGAELILACSVIGLAIILLGRGSDLFKTGSKQVTELQKEAVVGEYYEYNGSILDGRAVKELYTKYHLKGLKFEIATKETLAKGQYFGEIVDDLEQSDARFINERGNFLVEVLEDGGSVSGFRITQQ